jgi:hypothetical protein
VAITADDNVLPHVEVTKDGATLKLRLQGNIQNLKTLRAVVAMPALEALTAGGASRVHVEGFKSDKGFKARVSGASTLKGDLQAGGVDLEAQGASQVSLKGSANRLRLSAKEACTLSLGEFAVDRAEVTLDGACQATVQVKTSLDYDVSGASRLRYGGNAKVGKHRTSGASSASHQ